MNLLPADVGRPLTDLNVATIVPDLDQIIGEVIDRFSRTSAKSATATGAGT